MSLLLNREAAKMTWETPAYSDVRFGFEVTMYVSNR
jgi:coenzyme PQQ precursor peptide PqqA